MTFFVETSDTTGVWEHVVEINDNNEIAIGQNRKAKEINVIRGIEQIDFVCQFDNPFLGEFVWTIWIGMDEASISVQNDRRTTELRTKLQVFVAATRH